MADSLAEKILSDQAEVKVDGDKASVTVTMTHEYNKDTVVKDISNLTNKIAELEGFIDNGKGQIVAWEKQIDQLKLFREDLRAVLKKFDV